MEVGKQEACSGCQENQCARMELQNSPVLKYALDTAPELPVRYLEGFTPATKLADNIEQASMVESNGGKNKPTSSSIVEPYCGWIWQQFIMNSAF